jgi:hypothetical protein
MQPPTYAAGVRLPYQGLPAAVQEWVESQIGEPVAEVRNASGGFSPGVAAVVASAGGRRLFVKAVGARVNADSLRFYRTEREVGSRLPRIDGVLTPLGGVDLDIDGESFTVIVYPALDGLSPRHPWRGADLARVLDALHHLTERLTPSPWPAAPTDQRWLEVFSGWQQIAADTDDPWRHDPWAAPRLMSLVAAEAELRTQLSGDTLSHTDLRADNLVLTEERVWFVDWAHAQNAARWVDPGFLMADVIASKADREDGGEIDVAAVLRQHRSYVGVPFATLWRLQLSLAGALHVLSRRPSPPGLPTIRRWQGPTAETLLAWCRRESPSGF